MGNYKNLEKEFIERTLSIIAQYETKKYEYIFDEQYDHTLLINCLLGLIILPKERTITFIPKIRITQMLKKEMGIDKSTFNEDIKDLRTLIISLRHSVAHFDLSFESNDTKFLIDKIVFRDGENIISTFEPLELLGFIRYYSTWVIKILEKHKN